MNSIAPNMIDDALSLLSKGNMQDAYRILASIIENEPQNGLAYYHLAESLHKSKLFPAACLAFHKILNISPNEPQAMSWAAWNMHLSCRTLEAEPLLRRAVALNPLLPYAHMNLSQVLCYMNQTEEALVEAKKALDLAPQDAGIQMAYGLCLMFNGRLAEGLAMYRARYRYKMSEMLNVPIMKWDGRRCGKLFLLCEQGIGDCVQYFRFVNEAASRVDEVVLYCGKETKRIFESHVSENVKIVTMPATFPIADMWCPLLEVPVAMGLKDDDYERFAKPYIKITNAKEIEGKLWADLSESISASRDMPFKIGICWAGSPDNEIDQWRSASVLDFLPLAEIPGVELYSLQIGSRSEDVGRNGLIGLIKDLTPRILDVQDTINEIAQLDLVITIDSSVAHISGAMGGKTWVILNDMCSDYRYGRNTDQNSWYPSMVVFRRPLTEDSWRNTMSKVKQALIEEMAK